MSTAIPNLWPTDIKTDDVLTPEEILRQQAEYLTSQTNGLLKGDVSVTESDDSRILGFTASSTRVNATVRLFDVRQRKDKEYPAAVLIPDDDLPKYLQRGYYALGDAAKSTSNQMRESLKNTSQWVENDSVATSPTEFLEKVRQALQSSTVKSSLFTLIARSQKAAVAPVGPS